MMSEPQNNQVSISIYFVVPEQESNQKSQYVFTIYHLSC